MCRISNLLLNRFGERLLDRYSIFGESLTLTCEPVDVWMFCLSEECARTPRCCTCVRWHFASRFAIGSWVIRLRCFKPGHEMGPCRISLPSSTHFKTGSSRVLDDGSPTGH